MAKFYGYVGFGLTSESKPGVWSMTIEEREYYGDILTHRQNYSGSENVNDDITLVTRISVIADPFVWEHLQEARYLKWNGIKWSIWQIEPQAPRVIFALRSPYKEDS